MQFSIIIPAKNEERNISLCLEALRNQSFPNDDFEVIVVDNGSADGTVSVVERLGGQVCIKPELSISGLRNFGASVASGDVLIFLDADCIPESDWLNNAAITLVDTQIGCTGSTPVAPANGTWVEMVWSSFRTRRKIKCNTSWINSSNFFVRRGLFDKVNGFNENVKTCEDVDICMRLNKICKILFDPSIKVIHLGEPKTIKKFFLKEIWRGKGGISGIISHGISMSELKSLMLPFYYLIMSISIIVCIALSNFNLCLLLVTLYLIPAIIFSLWIITVTNKINYIFGYFILFLVYANARSISFFSR